MRCDGGADVSELRDSDGDMEQLAGPAVEGIRVGVTDGDEESRLVLRGARSVVWGSVRRTGPHVGKATRRNFCYR